jgi:hypothetical protein
MKAFYCEILIQYISINIIFLLFIYDDIYKFKNSLSWTFKISILCVFILYML